MTQEVHPQKVDFRLSATVISDPEIIANKANIKGIISTSLREMYPTASHVVDFTLTPSLITTDGLTVSIHIESIYDQYSEVTSPIEGETALFAILQDIFLRYSAVFIPIDMKTSHTPFGVSFSLLL